MFDITMKKMNILLPLLLLVINLIFSAFLIEELIDASDPNYGVAGFFTPIIGLISFIYIRKCAGKKINLLLRVLQLFNGIFIIFPIAIFFYGIIIMVNY
ncbi:hypothetical protein MHI39_24460 [Heyndrickxia sp. FSL K6-6286]|uniref:Uncharacterized protein n=1 Tax=Heyndrickxia oleronia TaxID=38875 RepID=A0AAW6T7A5_9BACI|nr:hypothetical protein [Heyndrickxia oleronia]MDH5164181.1 hypothetical protein [Heyndrickxia oleronia]